MAKMYLSFQNRLLQTKFWMELHKGLILNQSRLTESLTIALQQRCKMKPVIQSLSACRSFPSKTALLFHLDLVSKKPIRFRLIWYGRKNYRLDTEENELSLEKNSQWWFGSSEPAQRISVQLMVQEFRRQLVKECSLWFRKPHLERNREPTK